MKCSLCSHFDFWTSEMQSRRQTSRHRECRMGRWRCRQIWKLNSEKEISACEEARDHAPHLTTYNFQRAQQLSGIPIELREYASASEKFHSKIQLETMRFTWLSTPIQSAVFVFCVFSFVNFRDGNNEYVRRLRHRCHIAYATWAFQEKKSNRIILLFMPRRACMIVICAPKH